MSGGGRSLVVRTAGPEQTHAVGLALARSLGGGAVVSLEGPLGSGKTVLVRGVCDGLGVRGPVTSPTYTLENEYEGDGGRRIVHLDCFRLTGPRDLEDLDLDDRRDPDTLVLVEWGEKVIEALPPDTLRIRIEPDDQGDAGENGRRLVFHIPNGVNLGDLEESG
jgi:tRNA threonylcarbamoyladenosine biosynthesis protein TsaE